MHQVSFYLVHFLIANYFLVKVSSLDVFVFANLVVLFTMNGLLTVNSNRMVLLQGLVLLTLAVLDRKSVV